MTGDQSAHAGTVHPPSPRRPDYSEAERLAALHQTGLLDTAPEPEFDAVVQLAARVIAVPMASMSLTDDHRQWFKSSVGISHSEDELSNSICATVVAENAPLAVPDTRADERFAGMSAVVSGQALSCAGAPISGRDGLPLGTLCVFDSRPRDFESAQLGMLESLAQILGDALDLRRHDRAAGIDPLTARSLARELRAAVAGDELEVRFQPVTDLATGRTHRVEALVRWRHPERGLLMPEEFLPVAESGGLVHQIDRWVLRSAVRTVAEVRGWTPGARHLGLAVNVGLGPAVDLTWADEVAAVLTEHQLPPGALTLEITERGLDGAGPAARDALEWLTTLGCRVSIDDIGTGTSSLARLAELPATEIKIDRTFVQGMVGDRRRSAVVGAVARLGRELELDVVAEGVESADVARRVTAAGCTSGQGFHWSPPVDLAGLLDVFARRAV